MTARNLAFVDAFLVLQLTGSTLFLLTVLAATLRSGSKRHPIFLSFCLSWVVFGLSYSLLLLSGQQYKVRPNHKICAIQAALIYGSPFLEMFSSLALVIHLFLNVFSALSVSCYKRPIHRLVSRLLLTLPWLIWATICIGVFSYGLIHDHQVTMSPNLTYCVIEGSVIPKITAVAAVLGVSAIFFIQVMIGILLYRNRAMADMFVQSLGIIVRFLVFMVLSLGALSCGIAFTVTRTRGVEFDLIIGLLPAMAALTFGTQYDLLLFWIKPRAAPARPVPEAADVTLTTIDFMASPRDTESFHSSVLPSRQQHLSRPASPETSIGNEGVSFLHF